MSSFCSVYFVNVVFLIYTKSFLQWLQFTRKSFSLSVKFVFNHSCVIHWFLQNGTFCDFIFILCFLLRWSLNHLFNEVFTLFSHKVQFAEKSWFSYFCSKYFIIQLCITIYICPIFYVHLFLEIIEFCFSHVSFYDFLKFIKIYFWYLKSWFNQQMYITRK